MQKLARILALLMLVAAGLWTGLVILTLVDKTACTAAGGHVSGFRLCDVRWLRAGETRPQHLGSVLLLLGVGVATLVTFGRSLTRR